MDEALVDKALGHDIRGAEDPTVDLLLALDPLASRYGLDGHDLKLPHRARHWRVECRYRATRAPELIEHDIDAVVKEARAFVDNCVAELWSDGALPSESLK
ncbi:hypothetical protein [Comamonas sp. JC664]|uniref:hypothetical protein n=1 Tax=Comamonas sp. JC664 TaxID=2801917 RepID=UPI00174E2D7F|nr:hypothetical protein [Comamonas sp. JC664]MBL0696521.1 hypothetical protein [Comamonas sp. JC664]GHG84601.1 hypothetical protein GCM10012319_40480 [Comamonas sp. KCTC 72670]